MRFFLYLLFSLFFTASTFSQNNKPTDFSKVDKFALKVPDSVATSIEKLADYLTNSEFTSSTEKKVRAIFVWVSQNIKYDLGFDLTTPFVTYDVVATQNPDQVLARRKGVCMGYSQLFVALMQAAGLKAEMVEGIVKDQNGQIPRMGHAWVAVRLRKKPVDKDDKSEPRWYLCDPTWAAPQSKAEYGMVKEKYFLAEPEDFIQDHMPLDPMWQLSEKPIAVAVFAGETNDKSPKVNSKSVKSPFNFVDTINRSLRLDTLKRIEKATWRMLHYNAINEYIWFEVGKIYSNRFNALDAKINQLIQNSLLESTVLADEEKFESLLATLALYGETFKNCFSKINDNKIAQLTDFYNEAFISTLQSGYRSGFYIATMNKNMLINDKNIPRLLDKIQEQGHKIDSSLSEARNAMRSLDSFTKKMIERKLLQPYEEIGHSKRFIYLFDYLEQWRINAFEPRQKSEIYALLSQGRMHVRKYQACIDSIWILTAGKPNNGVKDPLFENYSFLFDVEECALNGYFIYSDINKKTESNKSSDLLPYIERLKDANACTDLIISKWQNQSKNVKELIAGNSSFFAQIHAFNDFKLGGLYHSIAINVWNENLNKDKALIRSDMTYYLDLADKSYDAAVLSFQGLIKLKFNEAGIKSQIGDIESRKQDIAKLRKEL